MLTKQFHNIFYQNCFAETENIIPPEYGGFSMPRCTHYEGRWIRSGDWYPDRVVRLFRKDRSFMRGVRSMRDCQLKGV